MSNTISHRIYDFLKDYPPFNFIKKEELLGIAEEATVIYLERGNVFFKQGTEPPSFFYVVKEGAVELYNENNTKKILVDICDEGDIFGIRPLVSVDEVYTLTAVTNEESLIYKLPAASFSEIMGRNNEVQNFFNSTFAAGIRNPYRVLSKRQLHQISNSSHIEKIFDDYGRVKFSAMPITCSPQTTIKEAANIMKEHNIGSIIAAEENGTPIGIITDRDFRNKVVAGSVSSGSSVSEIMSSPLITADENTTEADLQILMMKNNIRHVCITEDGSNKSKVIGIASEHDLLLSHANNPSVLIKEIKRSANPDQLKNLRIKAEQLLIKYLDQELSIIYISRIINEINYALTKRAIEIVLSNNKNHDEKLSKIRWCWLSLGSQGRGEQLLRSDQDSAILFEVIDADDTELIRQHFVEIAEGVTKILNHCGFDFCPANIMASNPKWCLSLSEWKNQFSKWIYTPGSKEVMYSAIFFDFNPVYGDSALADELTEHIFSEISKHEIFLSFLAKSALENPPPLSFFRNFMLEHNGEHKDEFDIKARAMMPLVDGARVLALSSQLQNNKNTIRRFEDLASLESENKNLYSQLANAFEIVMRFRALQGLKHNNSGRYFKPAELNKMQRLLLRNCFGPIKDLQTVLTVRFNLKMFG